jgi:F-type H+-transporting ATPase subunit epsilon
MKLLFTTPTALVVEAEGAFGIEPRHARFLTTLPVSVVSWRDAEAAEHHVAVRGGVLIVEDGDVQIATRQAIREDDLEALAHKIEEIFLQDAEAEEAERTSARRLHLATMRQIQRVLDASRGIGAGGRMEAAEDASE